MQSGNDSTGVIFQVLISTFRPDQRLNCFHQIFAAVAAFKPENDRKCVATPIDHLRWAEAIDPKFLS